VVAGPGGEVFTRLRHEDAVPGRAQRRFLPDRAARGRGSRLAKRRRTWRYARPSIQSGNTLRRGSTWPRGRA